jgi:hypothetical protein
MWVRRWAAWDLPLRGLSRPARSLPGPSHARCSMLVPRTVLRFGLHRAPCSIPRTLIQRMFLRWLINAF